MKTNTKLKSAPKQFTKNYADNYQLDSKKRLVSKFISNDKMLRIYPFSNDNSNNLKERKYTYNNKHPMLDLQECFSCLLNFK